MASLLPSSQVDDDTGYLNLLCKKYIARKRPRLFLQNFLRLIAALAPVWLPYGLTFILSKYPPAISQDTLACENRIAEVGFQGNSDFYGLGIRLGLYMQWLSFLWTTWSVPGAHLQRSIVGAHAVFQVSTLVALIVMIIQRQCTFTVETVVILRMLWGGSATISLQRSSSEDDNDSTAELMDRLLGLINLALFMVSATFHARLSSAGIADFLDTPGGTAVFVLPWIGETDKPRRGIFGLWKWLDVLMSGYLIMQLWDSKARDVAVAKKCLSAYTWQISEYVATNGMIALVDIVPRVTIVLLRIFVLMATLLPLGQVVRTWLVHCLPGKLEGFWRVQWTPCGVLARSLLVTTYSIATIEMTLAYNEIHGIQEVKSTGQLTPLVVGLLSIIVLGWRFWKQKQCWQCGAPLPGLDEHGPADVLAEATLATELGGPRSWSGHTARNSPGLASAQLQMGRASGPYTDNYMQTLERSRTG